jgi:hypothetical protein
LNLPIEIAFYVYANAKIRMLEFYYSFLLPNVGKDNFALCEMDTDSLYFAISGDSLVETVRANLSEEEYARFLAEKDNFLCNMDGSGVRDMFTPNLFKLEFEGSSMSGLNPKTHIAWDTDEGGDVTRVKRSQKGLSHRLNPFTPGLVFHLRCRIF